ncbi:MAG: type II toxin-antitoxin system HicA family toxin [Lachnospiraceae bacterium]|nr:type II toxin-antitoxin system HicA family toxin [Lachnospiraceae bacterium]
MSRFDKLIARIQSLDLDLQFAELQKVLEFYGYTLNSRKTGSSHYTFRKPGKDLLTIPKHKPIKIIYLKKVREIIEEEEKNERH